MHNPQSERDIKHQVRVELSGDFDIYEEVPGTHLIENVGVKCDFLVYPKPHLIVEGFDGGWIGIECKYINPQNSYHKKINQLTWQSISYGQSKFTIKERAIRPMFVLMCVAGGLNMLDQIEWRTLMHFAQYGNVGSLRFANRGWNIGFGGSPYFKKRIYGYNTIYERSKTNIGRARKVGNLSG